MSGRGSPIGAEQLRLLTTPHPSQRRHTGVRTYLGPSSRSTELRDPCCLHPSPLWHGKVRCCGPAPSRSAIPTGITGDSRFRIIFVRPGHRTQATSTRQFTAPGGPLSVTPVAHHLTVPRTARYLTLGEVESAREVWIVLHGYSMLAASFLPWFAGAARPGRLLVAPEGLSRSYFEEGGARRVGASWMTKEDREAEIEDYVTYLDTLADYLRAGAAQLARLEVHGFSQGAATGCRWVALGRHRVNRLVLWGGGVPPDFPLDRHGAALTRARLTVVIGTRDKYISATDIATEEARLATGGVQAAFHRFDGGHRVDRETLAAIDEGVP